MMNELCATVYRRLEIDYFSRDISYKFSSDFYMLDHHYVLPFISILPRMLFLLRIQHCRSEYSHNSALQLQCQLLVNHLCTKKIFF
jgi:hypothetical protein